MLTIWKKISNSTLFNMHALRKNFMFMVFVYCTICLFYILRLNLLFCCTLLVSVPINIVIISLSSWIYMYIVQSAKIILGHPKYEIIFSALFSIHLTQNWFETCYPDLYESFLLICPFSFTHGLQNCQMNLLKPLKIFLV